MRAARPAALPRKPFLAPKARRVALREEADAPAWCQLRLVVQVPLALQWCLYFPWHVLLEPALAGYNLIGDEGAAALAAALPSLTSLRTLDLGKCGRG